MAILKEESGAKGALIEKIAFALLPILFSCVVYLMSALNALQKEVTVLNQKVSLVVTSDNKQASNASSELAREKLKEELQKEIQLNRDMIYEGRQSIAVLEEKIKHLK